MRAIALTNALRGELPWVIAAQAISFLGGFAVVKVLAISLGTEGFGYYSLCLSLAAMISLLWYGPLDQIILRYWNDPKESKEHLFNLALSGHLVAISVLLPVSLCLLAASIFIEDTPTWLGVTILAILLSITKGMFNSTLSFHNASRNRRALFTIQALDIISRLVMIWAFQFFGLTSTTAILLTMLSAVFPVICSTSKKYDLNKITVKITNKINELSLSNLRNQAKHIQYGRSFILIGIFAAACNYADRWIILHNLTMSDVGIYSGIAQIATAPLIAITTISTQFLSPIIFSKKAKLSSASLYFGLASIYLFVTVLFFMFSNQIISLLLTDKFLPYHRLLPALTLGLSFFYMAQIYFINAQKNERPHIIKPAWAVRALSMLTLGIILSKKVGIWGLVFAIIFSSAAFFAILVISEKLAERHKRH